MKVIDDFFPEDMFKILQDRILGPTWTMCYIEAIDGPEWFKNEDPLAKTSDGFCLAMYDNNSSNKIITDEYIGLKPMFMYMLHKLGYTEENLLRVKCNMTLSVPGLTSDNYSIPHVDNTIPHKSVVFYVNDSDGDTRIFHQRQKPFNWKIGSDATEEQRERYANQFIRSGFTVEHTVSPKANRLLIFDGLQYHTAGFPVNSRRRVVLNFNIDERVEKVYD
jgi:hypothetical protein